MCKFHQTVATIIQGVTLINLDIFPIYMHLLCLQYMMFDSLYVGKQDTVMILDWR